LTVYQAPKFASSVAKQIDLMSSTLDNYTLPIMHGMFEEYITHSSGLPKFVSFNSPVYQFYPDKVIDLGISTISGQLFNKFTSISFYITLNVTN
jgi:hypothetical protein